MKISSVLQRFSWILPLFIFAIFVVLGATMHPLWGDEAEVALFGRAILVHGLPKGWDGVNLMGHDNALYLNADLINHSNSWPQSYFTALSFLFFGESDFSARLPFILFAIAGMGVVYFLTSKLTGNKTTAFLAVVILSFSVPNIMFAYQAHYYSHIIFFGLLFLYSSFSLTGRQSLPKILFVASGIGYIYNHYVSFPVFFCSVFLALFVYYLLLKKWREVRQFVFWYSILGMCIGIAFAPWFFLYNPLDHRVASVFPGFFGLLQQFPSLFYEGARYFNNNNAFPVLFLPLAIVVVMIKKRKHQPVGVLLVLLGIALLHLSAVGLLAGVFRTEPPTAVRHNIILLPVLIIAASILLETLLRMNKVVFGLIFGLFMFTNIFTLHTPRILLVEYGRELLNPYPTGTKRVAEYLNRYAADGETAFVNLEREHDVLQFYLKKQIRFVNRVLPNNPKLFPKNYTTLPKYTYAFRDKPDWVILFSKRPYDGSYFTYDMRPLPVRVDLENEYEETVIPVFFSDLSRPEIEIHSFEEVVPDYRDQIFIYRLKA